MPEIGHAFTVTFGLLEDSFPFVALSLVLCDQSKFEKNATGYYSGGYLFSVNIASGSTTNSERRFKQ